MWKKDFLRLGNHITLLIGQLIVITVCVAYVRYNYTTHILSDKQARTAFKRTQCFLVSKKLSTKGHFVRQFRSDFLVNYNVSGIHYNRWVTSNGLDSSFSSEESGQEDILSQYDVGSTYSCYYNPRDPQQVLLVFRHDWLTTFPLMLPAAIMVITLYYFLRNLRQLLVVIRRIKRSKK